jgi:hypothetical protein
MTFEEYLAIDAVNWSTLKEARKSPKHYLFIVSNPREDTARLALGRATHTAVLEPDRFILDFAVFRGPRRAGKDWDAFCAANKGRTILKLEEYATCLSMRDAVRAHPAAGPLLRAGLPEQTFAAVDKETGLTLKCRTDWLATVAACFADLKTTVDVERSRFAALATRMGYFGQLAFYQRVLRANGLDLPPKIIAVEAAEPHDVAVFPVDEDALWFADQEVGRLLRLVADCRASNRWPGRYEAEEPLAPPAWAFPQDDDSPTGLDLEVPATTEE